VNNSRKNCGKWVDCPHPHGDDGPCPLKVMVCRHTPRCIKAIPGTTEAEVTANPWDYFHKRPGFGLPKEVYHGDIYMAPSSSSQPSFHAGHEDTVMN
jgi:hypothetical protein